jgi:prepilin-type N-terminal cleavage/methylation domain-containing protein
MKVISTNLSRESARRFGRNSSAGSRRGFTMIEIAIALGVIAFALVAIIGILPLGMNVQRENREDTVINQDGPYWFEAIRSGGKGFITLSNFADFQNVQGVWRNPDGTFLTNKLAYQPKNMSNLVGLLSLPQGTRVENKPIERIMVRTRAFTGPAVDQGISSTNLAFTYLMSSEVVPIEAFPGPDVDFRRNESSFAPVQTRYDRAAESRQVTNNLYQVRLTFQWPSFPPIEQNGKTIFRTGYGRQTYRGLVSGLNVPDTNASAGVFRFFVPGTYAYVSTNGL